MDPRDINQWLENEFGSKAVSYTPGERQAVAEYPTTVSKIKSNGGSTAYYDLPPHAKNIGQLISHKGMSFARGNLLKALWRLGEKDGVDLEYDLNKMAYFVQELIEMHERGERL